MYDQTQIEPFLDSQGKLKAFPAKRKKKLSALVYLAGKFEQGKTYTEQEVNELLNQWHLFGDPATLRRELYNNRFLDRESNGSRYWLEDPQPDFAETE